jgi:hypothetical protein
MMPVIVSRADQEILMRRILIHRLMRRKQQTGMMAGTSVSSTKTQTRSHER